jgi:hypothetical protein
VKKKNNKIYIKDRFGIFTGLIGVGLIYITFYLWSLLFRNKVFLEIELLNSLLSLVSFLLILYVLFTTLVRFFYIGYLEGDKHPKIREEWENDKRFKVSKKEEAEHNKKSKEELKRPLNRAMHSIAIITVVIFWVWLKLRS